MKKLLIVTALLFIGSSVLAASTVQLTNPITSDSFAGFAENFVDFIFTVSIYLAFIIIALAGAYFVFSFQDPKLRDEAKKMIEYAVIGLIIIVFSRVFVDLFFTKMNATSFIFPLLAT